MTFEGGDYTWEDEYFEGNAIGAAAAANSAGALMDGKPVDAGDLELRLYSSAGERTPWQAE